MRASSEVQKLNQAEAMAETRSGSDHLPGPDRQFKMVQGKAFYANDGVWIDARVQEANKLPLTRIAFASGAYFELLKKQPELAPVLALGRHVRFVSAGRIIEIFDPAQTGF